MTEIAAQAEADAQWIINNTKPCPSCNSPIQKNEGCNHMTCRKVCCIIYITEQIYFITYYSVIMIFVGCVLIHGVNIVTELVDIFPVIVILHKDELVGVFKMLETIW